MYNGIQRVEGTREYRIARKNAKKNFQNMVSKGKNGYLSSLESIIKNYTLVGEQSLGPMEIPLKKITGTYEYSRSLSFSHNFLPLLEEPTEFSEKWASLYLIHIQEGIRDPIKAYEFMNWFYVLEGNKRVSIFKHLNAYSISGNVTRILPKKDLYDESIRRYYRFMDFYKKTKINLIWLSDETKYDLLEKGIVEYFKSQPEKGNHALHFVSTFYLPFRKVFHELGGGELDMTTGDAFIQFVEQHGFLESTSSKAFRHQVRELVLDLNPPNHTDIFPWRTITVDLPKKVVSSITNILPQSMPLRVAMIYPSTIASMGWNSGFESARKHLQKVFANSLDIQVIESVTPESLCDRLKQQNSTSTYELIISTSYQYWNQVIQRSKTTLSDPLWVCCEYLFRGNRFQLLGKAFQPRFLCGMISGMMTLSNRIGFIATIKHPEAYQNINAFALGVQSVNPDARVTLVWTNLINEPFKEHLAAVSLVRDHIDVLTHHHCSSEVLRVAEEYGVYCTGYGVDGRLFAPYSCLASVLWNWDLTYENLIRQMLQNKSLPDPIPSWGMSEKVLSLSPISSLVPKSAQRLIQIIHSDLSSGRFPVFCGPLTDQRGIERLPDGWSIDSRGLEKMDWLVDNIDLFEEEKLEPHP